MKQRVLVTPEIRFLVISKFGSITVDEIATLAGISRKTVYRILEREGVEPPGTLILSKKDQEWITVLASRGYSAAFIGRITTHATKVVEAEMTRLKITTTNKYTRDSDFRRDAWCEMYDDGKTFVEIAKIFDVSHVAVSKGIKLRKKYLKEIEPVKTTPERSDRP